MQTLTDVILYVPDFATLVGYLDANHPDMLARTESGDLVQPPVVTAFARTPATLGPDGNSLMVYGRLREDEVADWDGMPHVEVLARSTFTGAGTGQALYDAVFADQALADKYDSVYDRSPYETTDEDGNTVTVTPPQMFGLLAGA